MEYQSFWDERWAGGVARGDGTDTHGSRANEYLAFVKEAVENTDCVTQLDVACGSCNQWPECPVAEERFYGADISSGALIHASRRWPQALFRCADLSNDRHWGSIPSADLVTCTDSLNHLRPEDFKTVTDQMFLKAKKAIIIRMWTDPKLDGAGGYHWSHEAPEPEGFTKVLLRGPLEGSPWSIWAYRPPEQQGNSQ